MSLTLYGASMTCGTENFNPGCTSQQSGSSITVMPCPLPLTCNIPPDVPSLLCAAARHRPHGPLPLCAEPRGRPHPARRPVHGPQRRGAGARGVAAARHHPRPLQHCQQTQRPGAQHVPHAVPGRGFPQQADERGRHTGEGRGWGAGRGQRQRQGPASRQAGQGGELQGRG